MEVAGAVVDQAELLVVVEALVADVAQADALVVAERGQLRVRHQRVVVHGRAGVPIGGDENTHVAAGDIKRVRH